MSIEVVVGSEKAQFEKQKNIETMMLMLGMTSKTIYLNGGSETRADCREYWRQYAAALDIPFQVRGGCVVRIGHVS